MRASTPQLTTAGIGRADVWVFDATNLGDVARRHAAHHRHAVRRHAARARAQRRRQHGLRGGVPLRQPDDDGRRGRGVRRRRRAPAPCNVTGGRAMPGGLPRAEHQRRGHPGARDRPDRQVQPRPSAQWQDELGRNWSNAVRFTLPDHDVFAIDASARRRRVETAELRARRHDAVQHGRQPGRTGQGLRQQHRGAQRGALRGTGHRSSARRTVQRPPARGAHHRARRRHASCRAT